ncbi:MAG: hypothetical protein Q8N13_22510 [Acidovorax sp.]|nr:hypothetical protein [Acidovorax sp.]
MGLFNFFSQKAPSEPVPLKVRVLDEHGSVLQDLSLSEFGYNSLRWSYDLAVGALHPIASGQLSDEGFVSEEAVQLIVANKAVYLAQVMGIFCAGYCHYLFSMLSRQAGLHEEDNASRVEIQKGAMDGADEWFGPSTTPHRKGEYDSFVGSFGESQLWYQKEWAPRFLGSGELPVNGWPAMLNSRYSSERSDEMISESDLWEIDTLGILDPTEFLSSASSFFQVHRG